MLEVARIIECRAADAMAVERFVAAAPVLNERKVAPTAIQEEKVSV